VTDDRLERVDDLLAREGMHAELSVAGAEGEIIVIRAGAAMRAALARTAPEIRALGFRYVTIEIEAGV
jgi:hypothetical protein